MVAALAYGKLNNMDIPETIKLTAACASAACETEGTNSPEYDSIIEKLNNVTINNISKR